MEVLKKIKELIANGATEESLDELSALTAEKNYELQNTIIQLRRQMKDVRRAEAVGALSYQEASQVKGKINQAILDLLQELEGEAKPSAARARQAAIPRPSEAPAAAAGASRNRMWMMLGGGAVVLVLLILLFSGPSENETPPDGGTGTFEQAPPVQEQSAPRQTRQSSSQDNAAPLEASPDQQQFMEQEQQSVKGQHEMPVEQEEQVFDTSGLQQLHQQ